MFYSGGPLCYNKGQTAASPARNGKRKVGNMEIERKFLLKEMPREDQLPQGWQPAGRAQVWQGYLYFLAPVVRIRYRIKDDGTEDWKLCIKGPGTLARAEVETPLTRQQYEELCAMLPIPPVKKEFACYRLPDGRLLECSRVDPESPRIFCYAEVEFASEQEARDFVPPPQLGRDVTEEPYYAMASYWSRKLLWFKNYEE